MNRWLVPFARPPSLPLDDVAQYYELSEAAGWYTRGPCNELLAQRAAALGGPSWHAVPLSSGTIALALAIRAVSPDPDGRRLVAMPSFTCPAVAGAVIWAGYLPLFVDVHRDHWHLDVSALVEAVEQHLGDLAAVVAVANFGTEPGPELVSAWRAAADRADAPLIVDAAAGLASVRPAGQATVFSFEAVKPTGLGEGGLLLAPDRRTAEQVRLLAYYGIENEVAVAPGLNGKLSELSAAAALCRLDSAEELIAQRRQRGRELVNRLAGIVTFQRNVDESAWQFGQVLLPDPDARARALRLADARRIQVKTLWAPPLHRHPAFAELPRAPLPVTEDLALRMLSLPMAHDLSAQETDETVELVVDACAGAKSPPATP